MQVLPSLSPVSWFCGCQSQEGLRARHLIMGKALRVGPADGEGGCVTCSWSEWHPLPLIYGLYPLLKIMFHRESPPQRVFKYLNSLINFWESSCRNPPPWSWRKASTPWGCVTWQLVFGLLGSFTSFRQSQIFPNRSSKFQHWWAADFFPWLLNLSDIWQDRKTKVFYFIF